jgi:nucleoside-diphosphate-sugar epimerase
MKILVTGASGFIGHHVINELLKSKTHEIIATSKNKTKAENFDWYNKVNYIQCDLNEHKTNFYTFFNKPDIMIHLAWEGLPNYTELFHFERNLNTHYILIKTMLTDGLRDITISGTCFEYGMLNGCLSEDMITNPIMPYALAKDTLRKFIQELQKKISFTFKWTRLFYMYGEGQNPKSLIPQLNEALNNNEDVFNMSGGDQIRDYLPVEKVAEYLVKIALQNKITGIINCCSGNPITVKQLVENYINERNKKIVLNYGYYPYPNYVPMEFWGDTRKLKLIIK